MKPPRAAYRSVKRPAARPTLPATGFKAFIAYADLPAAREAMRTINEVLVASSHPYRLEPMLWRFDQIVAAKWHEPALHDAALADVVVLARSSAGSLPSDVEQWVTDFLGRKQNSRTTLVALLGQEDAWTISIEGPAARTSREVAPATLFSSSVALASRAA
jgi:hypothetical protein